MRGGFWFVVLGVMAGCSKPSVPPSSSDGGTAAMARPLPGRPPLPGDPKKGWALFIQHCVECHGPGRRGTGPMRARLLAPPADLRNPILLASRTDDELMTTILRGGPFVGRSKSMPAFAGDLDPSDAADLVALLRGDSIDLRECFTQATTYAPVASALPEPSVLAAYVEPNVPTGQAPRVLAPHSPPPDGRLLGYVMFIQVDLPKAPATPLALVADASGAVTGVRVALPAPDNERAQRDIEAVVRRQTPRLPQLVPVLTAAVDHMTRKMRSLGPENP